MNADDTTPTRAGQHPARRRAITCPTCGNGTIPKALAEFGRDTCDVCDPAHRGKVHCCVTIGWVTPAGAFDHRWNSPGWDD